MSIYDSYSGTCKCMSGYVFQDKYGLGSQCVSADSVCRDKYGVMADYDSLTGSCGCSYGYVFGKDIIGETQCISKTKSCQNQLGYNSRSAYGDTCECSYGYVIDGGKCEYGNTVCSRRHGTYSSYDSLSNSCKCDDDYTLDDSGTCVEKQHNVYFKVLDLNTETSEVIIKSEYDRATYLVGYGIGCSDFRFERYLGKNIVVNLGTDYSVDRRDRIVLQDHDVTCSIVSEERTWDTSFEDIYGVENPSYDYYVEPVVPVYVEESIQEEVVQFEEEESSLEEVFFEEEVVEPEYHNETKQGFWSKVRSFFKNLF